MDGPPPPISKRHVCSTEVARCHKRKRTRRERETRKLLKMMAADGACT